MDDTLNGAAVFGHDQRGNGKPLHHLHSLCRQFIRPDGFGIGCGQFLRRRIHQVRSTLNKPPHIAVGNDAEQRAVLIDDRRHPKLFRRHLQHGRHPSDGTLNDWDFRISMHEILHLDQQPPP